MALPNETITPIPDTEPDAVPSLWNTRYEEIDENFGDLDERTEAIESEVEDARGEEETISARMEAIEANVEGLDPDMQNMIVAVLAEALSSAGLANREVLRATTVKMQEGVVTIKNRGIIRGCAVTKSSTATRNLDMSAGLSFGSGRKWGVAEQSNGASVPGNSGAEAATCEVYLDSDKSLACTELGESAPDDALVLYTITVPAGNVEATDPYLASCTLTSVARQEPNWPSIIVDPPFESVALNNKLPDAEYMVETEVESFDGGSVDRVFVADRLANGFKLYSDADADTIKIRYVATRLSE